MDNHIARFYVEVDDVELLFVGQPSSTSEVAGVAGLNTNLTNWRCASLICVLGLSAVGLGLCFLKFFRG